MTTTKFDPALRNTSVVVALGAIMTLIDSTIVNVAVHVLGRDLGAPLATIQWVLTGYLLALSMTVPVTGWAIGRYGAKLVWITALSLFLAGSVLCGAAWSPGSLILFRVLQGVGGGLLVPVAQTMLARQAGPQRMARAMAVVSIPAMLAPALGPILGGLLLDHLSWRWMFLINVPVCAAALLAAVRLLPPETGERERTDLDVAGLALLSPAAALLVYGRVATLLAGVALLVAFVGHALRRRERALIDLRLFTDRPMTIAVSVLFCYSLAMSGVLLLIPLYAQAVGGRGVLGAGLLVAPLGAGAIVTMALAGRIADRFGSRRPALAGIVLVLAGMLPWTRVDAGAGWPLLIGAAFVMGLGHGAVTPAVLAGAYRSLPKPAIPHATVASTILIRTGAALGAAVISLVLQSLLRTALPASAFAHGFGWALGITALALLPALLIRDLPGRDAAGRAHPRDS
ncbi:DHA2 family efflux MFS transporter permease subunit [Paractinoplanes rhizophilus]|jgi:EmrB/QacA subfamily drug resistance transporter|uniref:DHA2 family efflux MFS transporter permease subunit n=1 Tax=Paractinoplanes rhizophilus TaxID=1416877 RepID=A0ABW2I0V0_9ACTN|nr:DHA2 family efflux MFS transporter permease subunit [Actinoplanes sp.]